MDFVLDASAREKRWALAPLPPQAPPTERPPSGREHRAQGSACQEMLPAGFLWSNFSSSTHPSFPCSLLPPQGPGGPGALAASTQRSVQVCAMQRRASRGQAPAVDSAPASFPLFPLFSRTTLTPTFLCWLLHLSLTLGFRVLTIHSALFISSSLSFKRRRPAEDWLGLLWKIVASSCSGCWDSVCRHPPCLAGRLSNDCPSWWPISQMCR